MRHTDITLVTIISYKLSPNNVDMKYENIPLKMLTKINGRKVF